MAVLFKELVFPKEISAGAIGGRGWNTDVVVTRGRRRSTNQNWPAPLGSWEVSFINRTTVQMRRYEGFMHAMRGSHYGFRFWDPRDHMIQNVGMARLTGTTFQIQQRYGYPGEEPFYILVTKPEQEDPKRVVTLGEVPTTDFTIDDTTGRVTFSTDIPTNVLPRYTGEYYIPAWLVTEKLAAQYIDQKFYSAENIHIEELVL